VSENFEGDWGETPIAYSKTLPPSDGAGAQIQKAAGAGTDEIVAVMKEVRNLLSKPFTEA
jgi:hypothetical protein